MDKLLTAKPNYFLLMFFVSILLVGFSVQAADKMSGKFFPSDSPILANYYPNDYLPVGIFLFLSLGWISIEIICRRFEGNQQFAGTILVLVGIYLLIAYVRSRLDSIWFEEFDRVAWARYLSELLQVWAIAWCIGGLWAFHNNRLIRFIKGHNS